jgi:hypothetical protein
MIVVIDRRASSGSPGRDKRQPREVPHTAHA